MADNNTQEYERPYYLKPLDLEVNSAPNFRINDPWVTCLVSLGIRLHMEAVEKARGEEPPEPGDRRFYG